MAKKRSTQDGIPLEGVVHRIELFICAVETLVPCYLAGQRCVSATIYLINNPTTLFEKVEVEQILVRKPGGSHDGSFCSKDTGRSSTDECKYFTVTTTKGTNRSQLICHRKRGITWMERDTIHTSTIIQQKPTAYIVNRWRITAKR